MLYAFKTLIIMRLRQVDDDNQSQSKKSSELDNSTLTLNRLRTFQIRQKRYEQKENPWILEIYKIFKRKNWKKIKWLKAERRSNNETNFTGSAGLGSVKKIDNGRMQVRPQINHSRQPKARFWTRPESQFQRKRQDKK